VKYEQLLREKKSREERCEVEQFKEKLREESEAAHFLSQPQQYNFRLEEFLKFREVS